MSNTTITTTTNQPVILRAFHNDADLKRRLLDEIAKHEAADAFIRGTYASRGSALPDGFQGCSIGCALHSLNAVEGEIASARAVNDHARFEKELGIPIELAYLFDTVFEHLDAERRTWTRRYIAAIPVGADLSSVMPTLLQWMILDPTNGFIALARPQFHETYHALAALVAQDWQSSGAVTGAQWAAIDVSLADCEMWAGARARARAWAWAGARARARAWAWAWACYTSYSSLSEQTLTVLAAAPVAQEQ